MENEKHTLCTSYINKLKNKVSIEKVIGEERIITRFGKNYFMDCPFCGSKQRLCISSEKQFGYCFECNESFDVIGYFQKVKKLSFLNSIIEIKKYINQNSDYEFQKLLRASICVGNLMQEIHPITERNINSLIIKNEYDMRILKTIGKYINFIISDFYSQNSKMIITERELNFCNKTIKKFKDNVIKESIEEKEKLINLFNYLLCLLNKIKNNNLNLGGLVLAIEY